MTLTPEEKSWLAEVEEQVAVALKFSSWGNAAPVLREQFPRLLALVKRLVGENEKFSKGVACVRGPGAHDLVGYTACGYCFDTLRSQLEVAREAMGKLGNEWAALALHVQDENRPYLVQLCWRNSEFAKAALAAIEGEGK